MGDDIDKMTDEELEAERAELDEVENPTHAQRQRQLDVLNALIHRGKAAGIAPPPGYQTAIAPDAPDNP